KVGVPAIFAGAPAQPSTKVGIDCWIGARAILMAGIEVGDGAIVGAGAVVTHDVPPFAIVGGVPSRVIGFRLDQEGDRDAHLRGLKSYRGSETYKVSGPT